MSDLPKAVLYTDGACSPNPGFGGWAYIILKQGVQGKVYESGGVTNTTNNRMELLAAVEGLKSLTEPHAVEIRTDSQYLSKAFTDKWLENWQKNGWKTAAGDAVKNDDLWKELIKLTRFHRVKWAWLKGHGKDELFDPLNDECDKLAVRGRQVIALFNQA